MAKTLEAKITSAPNEEKEWKDIKRKLATTSLKGIVILNVGGDKYETTIDTLTNEKNTFFTDLFSKESELERDPIDKSIFIDRNGKLFTYILEYMRTNIVPIDVMEDDILVHSLIIEAKKFRMQNLINILTQAEKRIAEAAERQRHEVETQRREAEQQRDEALRQRQEAERLIIENCFPIETLLQPEQKMKLNEFYGNRYQRWELIYKASRDGFDANAFHTRCNDKGPTITIVRSNNNFIFGGYTAVSWTSDGNYKNDTNAFLFTLVNPHQIPPTKYLIDATKIQQTVNHTGGYGPTFGGGHDLHVASGSNANNSSYTNFPHSYIDTTGKGNNTFTGARNFTATDIEVLCLLGNYFLNGTLLQPEQKMKLNEFYGNPYQRWELIYKASRDGFDANAFHTHCNGKGPTITIVRSNNNFIFGGYTSVSWTSDGNYKNDTNAFLFTLVNPHQIPPTKYLIYAAK
ncbi:unnamed protein product, partial [Rotaria sp. Silwood1]